MMPSIAIDVDNTLYSFDTACREAFFKMAIEYDDKTYLKGAYAPQVEWRSFGDVLGHKVLAEAIEKVHENTKSQIPYKGSVETVQALSSRGHEIKYVTTRHDKYYLDTKEWLYSWKFPTAPVYCSNEDKLEYISDCQYLIDDRPKTILNFIYDCAWSNNKWNEQRKAFGLWFPYNQALTDIRHVLLAPTWRGIHYYLERKGVL